MSEEQRYRLVHFSEIEPLGCPCGSTRRAFADDPDGAATMHVVEIKEDSETHYHKTLTEIYYVLEGRGRIEVDGESLPIGPGNAVLIKPGCRHRARGQLRIIVVALPAFDPSDEWFD